MFVCAECGQRHDQPGFCSTDGRALVATDDPLLGTEVGRYRLASLLGEGGMGRVYLGIQPAIGSRVAVKILSDQCARDPALLERFFAEAKAVNLIRHESIVSVLDLARLDDGRPYIVMEYVEGHVLASLIQQGSVPLGGLVQLFVEVLSALDAAHAIGIVHRDLKPDNILVTGEGHAKVLDFGIAKLAPGLSHLSPRTATGALLGTPAYMAPEQIGGGSIDPRTDIYAAGVVFYEAVTGRVPFAGETLFDLMKQHLEVPPLPPTRLRPDLPAALEQVILTALAKSPAQRFQTALAMAEATSQAASVLPPEQWRALVRGGVITGGRASLTKIPPGGRPPSGRHAPTGSAHDRTAAASPRGRASQPPPYASQATARPSSPPLLGAPQRLEPAPPAAAAPARRRWPMVVAVLGSAVVATAITVLAMRGGSADATGQPAPDQPGPPVSAPAGPATPPIVVGGGSAIDHGVHVGSNVVTGPNVVIGGDRRPRPTSPPAPTPPAPPPARRDFDPAKFDALAYLPKARALARQVYPDAELTTFEFYENVLPDGTVDLTLESSSTSYYEFRSPSHSKPAPTRNANPADRPCYVVVDITAAGATTRIREDDACDHQLHKPPRCTFAEVWRRSGTKDTIPATVGLLQDGMWWFDHDHAARRPGKATTTSLADCP